MITNLRYKETLTKAVQSLSLAKESLLKNISFEFVVLDLRVVLDSIGEITGKGKGMEVVLDSGEIRPLGFSGYDHFRRAK